MQNTHLSLLCNRAGCVRPIYIYMPYCTDEIDERKNDTAHAAANRLERKRLQVKPSPVSHKQMRKPCNESYIAMVPVDRQYLGHN